MGKQNASILKVQVHKCNIYWILHMRNVLYEAAKYCSFKIHFIPIITKWWVQPHLVFDLTTFDTLVKPLHSHNIFYEILLKIIYVPWDLSSFLSYVYNKKNFLFHVSKYVCDVMHGLVVLYWSEIYY